MAHIGMLPQQVREQGGYKVKGKTQSEAEALIADARAVEKAGAFSVVLEIVVSRRPRNKSPTRSGFRPSASVPANIATAKSWSRMI